MNEIVKEELEKFKNGIFLFMGIIVVPIVFTLLIFIFLDDTFHKGVLAVLVGFIYGYFLYKLNNRGKKNEKQNSDDDCRSS